MVQKSTDVGGSHFGDGAPLQKTKSRIGRSRCGGGTKTLGTGGTEREREPINLRRARARRV